MKKFFSGLFIVMAAILCFNAASFADDSTKDISVDDRCFKIVANDKITYTLCFSQGPFGPGIGGPVQLFINDGLYETYSFQQDGGIVHIFDLADFAVSENKIEQVVTWGFEMTHSTNPTE